MVALSSTGLETQHEATVVATRRIPSLDGLRAVSIGMVIAAHAFWSVPQLKILHHFGLFGVRIFFVISGFLITGILQTEWAKTGHLALGRFYKRRFWRLMPAFYAYLLFALLMTAVGHWALRPRDFAYAGLYLMNYYTGGGPWVLGHFWSLAVEEQFYLLWPVLFSWFRPPGARRVLVAALVLAPLTRGLLFPWHYALGDVYGTMFPAVCDALATGCLLATQRQQMHRNGRYLRFLRSNWHLILLPVCAGFQLALPQRLSVVFGPIAMNVAIAILIDGCVTFPASAFHRLLSLRFPVLIGRMSYSLYLWQQAFLGPGKGTGWQPTGLGILLTCTCASLSYWGIEQPFLNFGRRSEAIANAPMQ